VSIVVLVGMTMLDRPLKTQAAPLGIISFELAGTPERVTQILASWDEQARIMAGISLGVDFLFLMAYAFTLAGACRLSAVYLPPEWPLFQRVGGIVAGGQWCAAFLDVIENIVLIQMLVGSEAHWRPVLAAGCAVPKFILIGTALLFVAASGLLIFFHRGFRP